ncbi:hypothetical protein OsJ_27148 [Oryza sativa Japonica Group]|uniref:DRBM domain-containing protein n=1 Tax=Oryza sativa subsp. japonica TaxID=39947 RepID=A3BSP5_ORYSJ|nr:hypothetical protein OsJ_27148 [Oryza sativa Japonica Group]
MAAATAEPLAVAVAVAHTATAGTDHSPAPLHTPPPHCNYKSKLQEYLQQANKQLPIYCTKCKGEHHQLKFKSTVMVDGEEFSSTFCHRRVKDAEQDAAKVAYDTLLERKETETDDTDVFELIDQN